LKLIEFFENHYEPRRLFGKSANTSRLYRLSIASFGRTLARCPSIADLTDDNLRKHMQRVVANGRSTATANKDRSQLLAMWRFAFQLKMHTCAPDVPSYKEPERIPVAWLQGELQSLFETIAKTPGKFDRIPQKLWWQTLVRLALDTGERIGALSQVRWDWIQAEWILVPAEARKGSRADRSYRLSSEVVDLLEQVRKCRASGPLVFHWPYCRMYLWTKYKKLLKEAGLPSTRRDAFHKLRRTTASVSYAAGLDPQDVLDHQYRRTTQRYLDPKFQRTQQPCDILAAYLANPGKKSPPAADSARDVG